MIDKRPALLSGSLLLMGVAVVWLSATEKPARDVLREQAMQTERQGNYKDAYESLRKLALDAEEDPLKVGDDLDHAVQCLANLGRVDETDDFLESAIAIHKHNWRLLDRAAQ